MTDVTPITPDLEPVPESGQRLHNELNRDYAQFTKNYGPPVGYALVLISAEGTAEPFYQTTKGSGGWRSFLALAGAMLVERALK